jgi:NADPH:quinone reductase-like Zn-dependent oxidoreductase
MQRYEIQSFGVDALTLTERDDPTPQAGEVVIAVRAVSLNRRDLMMVEGAYNPRMALPRVPCSDGVGVVEAVGEGVTRVKAGDRVAGIFMQGWFDGALTLPISRTTLGGNLDGMLARKVVLHEDGLVHVPGYLSDEEASTLPCAALTAWNALVESSSPRPGQSVLVQGTGGVSIFALQIAKLFGARVIATSSSDEKLGRVRSLGADETINYKTTPDRDKAARELTGGVGVDHVVEVGGAGTMNRSLNAARMSGRISVIGALAGGAGEVATVSILQKNLHVQGIFVGSRAMFERMNAAFEQHQLRPVIDRVFPFAETRAAFHHMKSGQHFGKIVIKVS